METVNINQDNFSQVLGAYLKKDNISIEAFAMALKCSKHTVKRLLEKNTIPTEDMLKQTVLVIVLSLKEYKKLSESQKEKLSETLGITGGGIVGLGSLTALISSLGTVGLSAAGITSGLATLGTIAGGGMMAGIMVAGAIPILGVGIGYGIVKSIKWLATSKKYLDAYEKDIDTKWENIYTQFV
jgi:transcriptional regulator with XRE-family HTH domain